MSSADLHDISSWARDQKKENSPKYIKTYKLPFVWSSLFYVNKTTDNEQELETAELNGI